MLKPAVDFWFEFASSYSYPAAMRISTLAEAAEVTVRWRPFLLGPIFKAQGWTTSPFNLFPAKGRNMWRDLERTCGTLGLPFVRPKTFPQNTLLVARVALVGLAEAWGEDYCRAVYRAEFGAGHDIQERDAIAGILTGLGLNAGVVLDRARSNDTKSKLRTQTEDAERLGIFGSPSFITADGELFWGNDRLEAALNWAKR
jgi:2-hydroxychromene-2-carboxylate isomerase